MIIGQTRLACHASTLARESTGRMTRRSKHSSGLTPVKLLAALLLILFAAGLLLLSGCWPLIGLREYSVSGTVFDQEGNPLVGAIIAFSSGMDPVETAQDGSWRKDGLRGQVTITPSHDAVAAFEPWDLAVSGEATTVDFVVSLTMDQAEGIAQTAEWMNRAVETTYDSGRKESSLHAIATAARANPLIVRAGSDANSLWVQYLHGGMHAWVFDELSDLPSTSSTWEGSGMLRSTSQRIHLTPSGLVGNRKAVIVNPLAGDARYAGWNDRLTGMAGVLRRAGFSVYAPEAATDWTLESLKNLSDYGFIFYHGHGRSLEDKHGNPLTVLQTGQRISGFDIRHWFPEPWVKRIIPDWREERIVKITIMGVTYWGVTATFFQEYTKATFPESVFIAWACESIAQNDLASTLSDLGVQAYLGWDQVHRADPGYALDMVSRMLTSGWSLGEALDWIWDGRELPNDKPNLKAFLAGLDPPCSASPHIHPNSGRDARLIAYVPDSAVVLETGGGIRAIDFTLDGRYLAFAAEEEVYVYRTSDWHLIRQFGVGGDIRDITYSPSGQILAVAVGQEIRLYHTSTWRRLPQTPNGGATIVSACFSPQGNWLVFGTQWQDADIYVYDTSNWARVAAFAASDDKNSVHFDPQQRFLGFTSTYKYFPKIRTAGDWQRFATLTGGYGEYVHHTRWYGLTFSPDGRWVAYGFVDSSIHKRWLYVHRAPVQNTTVAIAEPVSYASITNTSPAEGASAPGAVDFSPDGRYVAHGCEMLIVYEVDQSTGQLEQKSALFLPSPVPQHCVRFSRSGGLLAYTDGSNVYVRTLASVLEE